MAEKERRRVAGVVTAFRDDIKCGSMKSDDASDDAFQNVFIPGWILNEFVNEYGEYGIDRLTPGQRIVVTVIAGRYEPEASEILEIGAPAGEKSKGDQRS